MSAKKINYIAATFLLLVGVLCTIIAIFYLDTVSSHGWSNVWQTGSVGLIALAGGLLTLWDASRKR